MTISQNLYERLIKRGCVSPDMYEGIDQGVLLPGDGKVSRSESRRSTRRGVTSVEVFSAPIYSALLLTVLGIS